MNNINTVLHAIYDRLALPQPVRTRVLLELSGDMEDMKKLYVDHGMSDEDAEKRVLESFDLSDDALEELVKIHCRPLRRFLDHLSFQSRGILERMALVSLAVLCVMILIKGLMTQKILSEAGPLAWPVFAALVGAVLSTSAKLYQLHILQDHRPHPIRRFINLPLGLAGIGLGLGFLGMYGHIFYARFAGGTTIEAVRHLAVAVHRSAALLTISMSTSLLGAIMWFVSTHTIARLEEDEASLRLGLVRDDGNSIESDSTGG